MLRARGRGSQTSVDRARDNGRASGTHDEWIGNPVLEVTAAAIDVSLASGQGQRLDYIDRGIHEHGVAAGATRRQSTTRPRAGGFGISRASAREVRAPLRGHN